MLFTIEHTTEYRFTRPVFFEPHQLRFQPRNDAVAAAARGSTCTIDPTPAGTTQSLDADGNLVTMAWFNDVHDHMTIRATSRGRNAPRESVRLLADADQQPAADRLSAVGAVAVGAAPASGVDVPQP